ncbi:hypothetical protein LTR53_016421 [Teratosphaeriaceae sp. CCFEE 6253]|nr:hypothetical protein LTR53_016421 [Teratosphaeriaceae sp. CCFEE 6253]
MEPLPPTQNPGQDSIRLIMIALERTISLAAHIQTFRLSDAPDFSALSYCWGDQAATTRLTLFPQRHDLYITPSLGVILRRLSDVCPARWLWIDAICIDQSNEREKSHQVSLMREIFERADSAYVWLGQDDSVDLIQSPDERQSAPDRPHRPESELWGKDDIYFMPAWETLTCKSCIPSRSSDAWETGSFNDLSGEAQRWQSMQKASRDHGRVFLQTLHAVANSDKTWWSRLWSPSFQVIQELAAAKRVYVFAGEFVLTWHAFVTTFTTKWGQLDSAYKVVFPEDWSGLEMIQSIIWELHNCRMKGWGDDLLTVIRKTEHAAYSVPQDRIYAILGLTSKGVRDSVRIDYQASVADVFATVVVQLMQSKGGLDVLFDWLRLGGRQHCTQSSRMEHYQAAGSMSLDRHGRAQYRWYLGSENGTLNVPGCCLDLVEDVMLEVGGLIGLYDPHVSDFEHVYGALLPALRPIIDAALERSPPDHDATSMIDRTGFLKALSLGREVEIVSEAGPICTNSMELFGEMIEAMLEAQDLGLDVDAAETHVGAFALHVTAFRQMLDHFFPPKSPRSLFATRHGFVGVANNDVKRGDLVAVVYSASTPIVLRRARASALSGMTDIPETSSYALVSDCYVHGVMDGEIMALIDRRLVSVQTFSLVQSLR